MDLNKLVTIVIPCKNEKDIILKTLDLLNHQVDIKNVKVIVCDASNDGVTKLDLLEVPSYSVPPSHSNSKVKELQSSKDV